MIRKIIVTIFVFASIIAGSALLCEVVTGNLPIEGNSVDINFCLSAITVAAGSAIIAGVVYADGKMKFV